MIVNLNFYLKMKPVGETKTTCMQHCNGVKGSKNRGEKLRNWYVKHSDPEGMGKGDYCQLRSASKKKGRKKRQNAILANDKTQT